MNEVIISSLKNNSEKIACIFFQLYPVLKCLFTWGNSVMWYSDFSFAEPRVMRWHYLQTTPVTTAHWGWDDKPLNGEATTSSGVVQMSTSSQVSPWTMPPVSPQFRTSRCSRYNLWREVFRSWHLGWQFWFLWLWTHLPWGQMPVQKLVIPLNPLKEWLANGVCTTDECEENTDCGPHGECIDASKYTYPKKQCYCQPGWFGLKCDQGMHADWILLSTWPHWDPLFFKTRVKC